MLKGMFLSVERRRQDWRGAKNVYTFGACEKRGQRDACGRKGWDSWQDTVAKIARQRGENSRTERSNRLKRLRQLARYRGEDSRKDWGSRHDGVEQIAGKADADGKKSLRGREERRGKNGKDNRQEAGGGGRKKLMSMKIIG